MVDELEEKPDLIVLDPPRDGIHPKAIGKILNLASATWFMCPANQPALRGSGTDPGWQDIRWIRCAAWICSRILPIVRRWFH
ncbi:MAG: hypothetical protein ACLR8P_12135 [Clostridium fessum]